MGELLMEIDKSFDNLVDTIKESSIYKDYQHILEQVRNNADIKESVKNIKSIQKKIVNEHYKGNDTTILESELESININLNKIPLYQDYIESSKALNELVTSIASRLQTYLNDLDI
jgi:cell fate (sporulation/competence/biofilm development) regulator YmcA (YheA/YmcA/DUF963 family)